MRLRLLGLGRGDPVVVAMLGALLHAGLPHDDYCYGGKYFNAKFLLDENDRLSESTDAATS